MGVRPTVLAAILGQAGRILPKGFVAEGDSLTAGLGAIAVPYPSRLAARSGLNVINRGHSGDLLSGIDSAYATDVAPYYNAASANTLVINGGTNELFNSGTAAQIQASMLSICAKARATGFRVFPVTIPPSTSIAGGQETQRSTYVAWLRANYSTFADGLVDWAAVPQSADPSNTVYYLDGTHPTDLLLDLWAQAVAVATNAPTVAAVTTPSAFSFVDTTAAAASTVYTSAAVTILGINAGSPITVSGGTYSINGGAFVSTAGTVFYGDTIRARATSSATSGVPVNCIVTVGGVSDTYTVTTGATGHVFGTPTFGTATQSNGGKTILTTTTNSCVPADAALTGKKVFSMLLEASQFVPGVGFTSKGSNTGGIGDDGARSISFYSNGAIYRAGGSIGTGVTYSNAAHVGIVIDVTAAKAWATLDGITFMPGSLTRAQVEAGTGGVDITTTVATGALYPAAGGIVTAGQQWTLDTAYPWTVPSGYTQY